MNGSLILWFALGLLLGWLIEWLIDRAYWRRRLRDFELQLNDKSAALTRMQADLDGVRADLSGRDEDLDAVRLELRRRDAELEAASAARASDVERLTAELDAVRAARAAGAAEVERLTAELAAAKAAGAAEVERLTAELDAARAALSSSESELQAARDAEAAETAHLRAELETTRSEFGRQGFAAAALGAAAVGATAGAADGEAEELRATLTQHEGRLAAYEGQVQQYRQREAELKRALLVMRDALARSRGETDQERTLRLTAAPGDDPLIDIIGIGPVYQQRLYDAGVRSFAQLAALDEGRLREIVGPEEWQQLDLGAWIAEARTRAGAVQRERDPLVDINGIGPVYERRLFEAGVNTFAELAVLTPERLREIVGVKDWQQANVEAWIAEARELAIQVRAGTYRKGVV
jgi:predicted flap endonuclease-1-like 5' DNA nuclease